MLVCPIIVGGGTPFLPDGVRVPLEPLAKREFGGWSGESAVRRVSSAAKGRIQARQTSLR